MSGPSDARTAPTAQRFRELIGSVSSVVAPLTLITAILFYFGYASSRAQYAYFGLDIDTIGLSTQDFVIRSPQPLLVPLLAIGLIGAAVALGHAAVRRRIATAHDTPPRLVRLARSARGCSVLGWTALAAGVFLVLAYAWLRGWAYYPIVAPGVLAAGAALTGYGLKLDGLLGRRGPTRRATAWWVYVVLATSLFWATATVAELFGRGRRSPSRTTSTNCPASCSTQRSGSTSRRGTSPRPPFRRPTAKSSTTATGTCAC